MTARTVSLRLSIATLLISFVYNGSLASAQQTYPYLGEVTGDRVNVRSGQSANFERLCQLDKGDEVLVLEKEYSWYKIQLPASAKSYVHKKYVQYLGQNAGGIIADSVNIRAGAGIHHTVVGQLEQGEQIFIEEESEDWYRIQPVIDSYGWIAEEFVKFRSNDISAYKVAFKDRSYVALPEETAELIEVADEQQETTEIQPVEKTDKTTEEIQEIPQTFYAVGYVEPFEDDLDDQIYYKITAAGRPVCLVQGTNHILGRFKNLRVSVEGTVNQSLRSKYAYPVIIVSKVRLML